MFDPKSVPNIIVLSTCLWISSRIFDTSVTSILKLIAGRLTLKLSVFGTNVHFSLSCKRCPLSPGCPSALMYIQRFSVHLFRSGLCLYAGSSSALYVFHSYIYRRYLYNIWYLGKLIKKFYHKLLGILVGNLYA